MKPVHAIAGAAVLGTAAIFAPAAFAQAEHGHGHMGLGTQGMDAPARVATGGGEVRKIDLENRKVTLKHDASKDMNMPAMTMVYAVAQPAMLAKVKVGDKVRFRMATVDGRMTITDLQTVH